MSTRTKANSQPEREKPTCRLAFLYKENKKARVTALTYLLLLRISCQTFHNRLSPPDHFRFALPEYTAVIQYADTFLLGKLLMLFLFLSTFNTLWQASIFSGEPCAVLYRRCKPLSDDCLPAVRLIAPSYQPRCHHGDENQFFHSKFSNVRQAQNLPRRASEDGEWWITMNFTSRSSWKMLP